MNKKSKIIQWFFSVIFLLLIPCFNNFLSAIFLVIGAILMAPISGIRKLLKKAKIKEALSITLAICCLLFSIFAVIPNTKQETETNSPIETQAEENKAFLEEVTSALKNILPETNSNKNSSDNSNVQQLVLSDIPDYNGSPYIVINNNKPNFSQSELTTKAYENYSPLDNLGRCGVATASCGKEIMPKEGEKRGSISEIKPSGWKQNKYDCVDGGWLYNRSHLIGWQLSAENANKRNLITGTRYMNVEGMLPFENMVADYIDETHNHVAYKVSPIYNGNNLLASGVQIEAYSIEDNGAGVCFNVYCYNVQPGITINYATGENH